MQDTNFNARLRHNLVPPYMYMQEKNAKKILYSHDWTRRKMKGN